MTGLEPAFPDRQSGAFPDGNMSIIGGPDGLRSRCLLIDSQALYQLSYRSIIL